MSEDTQRDDGLEVFEDAPVTTDVSTQSDQPSATADAPGEDTPASPPPASGLGKDELETILTRVLSKGQPANQSAPPPRQYTRDEMDQAFNVYKFQADKLQKLGYSTEQIDEILPVYDDMRDGIVKQSSTMAAYLVEMAKESMMKEIAPLKQMAEAYQAEENKKTFYTKFPDLKDYEPVLLVVRDRLLKEGRKFESNEEAMTAIANGAREILKVIPKPAGGGGQPASQTTTKMSSVSAGGQGGVGGAPKSTAANPDEDWKSVFS